MGMTHTAPCFLDLINYHHRLGYVTYKNLPLMFVIHSIINIDYVRRRHPLLLIWLMLILYQAIVFIFLNILVENSYTDLKQWWHTNHQQTSNISNAMLKVKQVLKNTSWSLEKNRTFSSFWVIFIATFSDTFIAIHQ